MGVVSIIFSIITLTLTPQSLMNSLTPQSLTNSLTISFLLIMLTFFGSISFFIMVYFYLSVSLLIIMICLPRQRMIQKSPVIKAFSLIAELLLTVAFSMPYMTTFMILQSNFLDLKKTFMKIALIICFYFL